MLAVGNWQLAAETTLRQVDCADEEDCKATLDVVNELKADVKDTLDDGLDNGLNAELDNEDDELEHVE